MTAVVSTRCRRCGAELTDPFSRKVGYGPECRKDMTPDQLVAAIRANQPGHIPAARSATATARVTNAQARDTVENAAHGPRCVHDGIPGSCALCRRDNNPAGTADRIIALIQRQRTAARDAAYEAWKAAHQPEPEQLEIGA